MRERANSRAESFEERLKGEEASDIARMCWEEMKEQQIKRKNDQIGRKKG